MYKRILLFTCFAVAATAAFAQKQRIDSTAVYILQRTSSNLQGLNACTFTAVTTYDVWSDELSLVKHSVTEKIYMKQPDKMSIHSRGDRGHRLLMYNGKNIDCYSYDNNRYGEVAGPSTVIEAIDELSKKYSIELPAADFFYPTFVDDIIATGGNLIYLGLTDIDGQQCFHIAGKDANTGFQLWISNDPVFLPVKIVMIYYSEKGAPQYEESYHSWELNPSLSDAMFEFHAPPKATKVEMVQKKDNK